MKLKPKATKKKRPAPAPITRETGRALLSDLKPYPKNARTHTDAQIEHIASLVRVYGQTMPILVDEANTILAGHARAQACAKVGMKEVEIVRISGLADEQKQAYVIADNQSALLAGWDNDLLRLEMTELAAADFSMDLLGFDSATLSWLTTGDLVTNPGGEWSGMPSFVQPDARAFKSIVVHFKDQKQVDKFAKLIGQEITDKTRFLWYPNIEIKPFVKYA